MFPEKTMGCWFEDDDKRRIKLGQLFLNNLLRIKENNNVKTLTVDIFGVSLFDISLTMI